MYDYFTDTGLFFFLHKMPRKIKVMWQVFTVAVSDFIEPAKEGSPLQLSKVLVWTVLQL